MKIIPLHCLVICEEPTRLNLFCAHEIVDLLTISDQLVGSSRRHDLAQIIYNELRHRVALKLSLGERIVINPRGLSPDQQRQLSLLAQNQGAEVFKIGSGTGIGETIQSNAQIGTVSSLPRAVEAHLQAEWEGITVIGDVHGELGPLEQALDWARSRRHFVWLLGDVVDYGKQPLASLARVHQAVMRGEASMVLANHERKIARWLDREPGEHLRISDGNRVTIDALERLPVKERNRWMGKFRALLSHTSLVQQIGHVTLMHAAAHPSLWNTPEQHAIEQYALYGESDQTGGRYKRTHKWIDAVPNGQMVIVGHDIICDYPTIVTGIKGGQVVFLDTGCGKGGKLSTADLRFTDHGLHLECFNRH